MNQSSKDAIRAALVSFSRVLTLVFAMFGVVYVLPSFLTGISKNIVGYYLGPFIVFGLMGAFLLTAEPEYFSRSYWQNLMTIKRKPKTGESA